MEFEQQKDLSPLELRGKKYNAEYGNYRQEPTPLLVIF